MSISSGTVLCVSRLVRMKAARVVVSRDQVVSRSAIRSFFHHDTTAKGVPK